jgi:hypothetical protein
MRRAKGPTFRLFPKLTPRVVRNWDEVSLCCAGLTSVTIGWISLDLG